MGGDELVNNLISRKQELLIRVHNYINGLSTIKFILIATVLRFIVLFLLIPLYKRFPMKSFIPYDGHVLWVLFMFCIAGPIRETFIFQFIPLEILKVLSREKEYRTLHVLISALIFGICHFKYYESIAKVIDISLVGVVLGYTYVNFSNKNKDRFWITTALHGFISLITLAITPILVRLTNI